MSSEEEKEEEELRSYSENSEENDIPLNRENILGCLYVMIPKIIRFLFLTLIAAAILLSLVLTFQYGIVMPLSYRKNHLEYNMTTGCPLDGSNCHGREIGCPTEPAFHWGCFGLGIATLALLAFAIFIIGFILNTIWIHYKIQKKEQRFKPQ